MAKAEEEELVAKTAAAVDEAAERIAGHVYRTPAQPAPWLASRCGAASVHLKLESEQVTGSFKARGALNKLLLLASNATAPPKVVTASTGNHALATAHAAVVAARESSKAVDLELFLPASASTAKLDQLRAANAKLQLVEGDCCAAEAAARVAAAASGREYVSPYNDEQVMAGQGTTAVEMAAQCDPEVVFVPVGGGGLIGGIAAWFKARKPGKVTVVGCGPANDAHMAASVKAGRLLPCVQEGDAPVEGAYVARDTLSEGTAGAVEKGSVTFDVCRAAVDDWVEVSEEDIAKAVVDMLKLGHKAVEGAAGLGIAAVQRYPGLEGKRVAVVVCGGNVKAEVMRDLLQQHL